MSRLFKSCKRLVLLAHGDNISQASKQLGTTDKTYCRWRKSYGDMKIDRARRLKALENKTARLGRAVSDVGGDKMILKEVAEGKYGARLGGARQ